MLCRLNYLELEVIKVKILEIFCDINIREMRNTLDESCHDRPMMMHLVKLKMKKFFKNNVERVEITMGITISCCATAYLYPQCTD